MTMITVRWIHAVAALLLTVSLVPSGVMRSTVTAAPVQEMRLRRDIRQVEQSPEELKNLRHAFFRLMNMPRTTCDDADAKTEYDCWAAYHNNFDKYGCRHLNDLFWPWHRYHLAEFEKALRQSDPQHPERVKDVTLPYWNWTSPPSGKDFPAALEQRLLKPGEFYPEDCPDPNNCVNPLFVPGRRTDRSCQQVKDACVREAIAVASWRDFAGGVQAGQASDFEAQAHNFMHARYIAGPMGNPTTAARDPIYWFFHAYIDNVWDQWQVRHQQDACAESNIPDPSRRLTLGDWPPSTVTFRDVLCVRNLSYAYDRPAQPPPPALPSCPARGEICRTDTPQTPVLLPVPAIPPAFDTARMRLSQVSVPDTFSYDVWILMHPVSERYQEKNQAFVDRWASSSFVVWRGGAHGKITGGHAHPATMDLQLDVTEGLKKALGQARPDGVAATLVFSASSKAERSTRLRIGTDVTFARASLMVTTGTAIREIPLQTNSPGIR